MVTHNANRFTSALKRLNIVFSQDANAKSYDFRDDVASICQHADRHGLVTRDLSMLLRVVVKPHALDQASINLLFKSLFPSENVPNESIYSVVASLGIGQKKASETTQQALVKWLALVVDLIDPSALLKCYAVLFNLLDVLYLRSPLCYLLARITRRKHVKPFRIQMLRRLEAGITSDPSIAKLAGVFQTLVPGSFGNRKLKLPIIFAHPDTQWAEHLQMIMERTSVELDSPILSTDNLQIGGSTVAGTSSEGGENTPLKEARDLHDLDDIINCLGKVKLDSLPRPGASFARLQHYSALTASKSATEQIHQGFREAVEESKVSIEGGETVGTDFLESLLQYARYWKDLPEPVLDFLQFYIPRWRPVLEFEQEDLLLELMSYLPIRPWSELRQDYLAPLENNLLDGTLDPFLTLLNYYGDLAERWIYLLSNTEPPPSPDQNEIVIALATHTALLSLTALTLAPTPTQVTINAILSHLECLLPLASAPLSLPLPPPQPLLISTILFASPTLSTLSQTSTLLARYKQAFETPLTSHGQPRSSTDINTLNAALLDTCNLLLRSRAFNKTDTHALGCLVPESLLSALTAYMASLSPSIQLQHAFSLSCHPALAVLSNAAFREIEDQAQPEVRHAGPVGQKSLGMLAREGGIKMGWREYRVQVLRWLEEMGPGGIGDLGRATMRGLMGGEKGRESDVARIG